MFAYVVIVNFADLEIGLRRFYFSFYNAAEFSSKTVEPRLGQR